MKYQAVFVVTRVSGGERYVDFKSQEIDIHCPLTPAELRNINIKLCEQFGSPLTIINLIPLSDELPTGTAK